MPAEQIKNRIIADFWGNMWYNKHNIKVEKRDRFSYYVFIEPVWSKPIGGLHLWYNKCKGNVAKPLRLALGACII